MQYWLSAHLIRLRGVIWTIIKITRRNLAYFSGNLQCICSPKNINTIRYDFNETLVACHFHWPPCLCVDKQHHSTVEANSWRQEFPMMLCLNNETRLTWILVLTGEFSRSRYRNRNVMRNVVLTVFYGKWRHVFSSAHWRGPYSSGGTASAVPRHHCPLSTCLNSGAPFEPRRPKNPDTALGR